MKVLINLFNEEPQSHEVHGSSIYVGRSSQCDVIINHESMSRKHCLIEVENGQIFVTDLGSTNGVTIDGNRIAPNEKTFYLNSLPLMIGAANVTIDLTDHQTKMINITKEQLNSGPVKSTTGSYKTATAVTQKEAQPTKISNTAPTLELEKNKTPSKGKTSKSSKKASAKSDDQKKKELLMALIAVLIFVSMAAWYFTQN